MAVNYSAFGKIKLKAVNSATEDQIMFFESSEFVNGPAYDDGADTPEPMSGQQLYFYAVGSDDNYSSYADMKLQNIPLVIQGTATDAAYQFTFSNWTYNAGQAYKLYDKQENVWINLANTTEPYDFTITAGTTVSDRFYVEPVLFYPREVANDNWGTICYPELIDSIQGAVVYEIGGSYNNATQIAVVPVAVANMVAGKPYIFQATAAAQKFFYNPDVTATLQEGACGLTGTFVDATLGTDGYYVIKGQSFIPALGSSAVLANRAYLALTDISAMEEYVPTPGGVSARFFSVIRGTVTEDMQVAADGVKDGSYLVNGRLVIVKDGKTYNAQGF